MSPRGGGVAQDATASKCSAPRILGNAIAPLMPVSGPVHVLVVGEAPGPRGADKSGIPFFGDAAGKHLYQALRLLGAVRLPDRVDQVVWDGTELRNAKIAPIARAVSLTNAFDRCPTNDGFTFRAPARDELRSTDNEARLRRELDMLLARGLTGVVSLGKVATRTLQHVLAQHGAVEVSLHELPHPSAQGLLSMAPNRGRGARMADLQGQWTQACMAAVQAAGFDRVELDAGTGTTAGPV